MHQIENSVGIFNLGEDKQLLIAIVVQRFSWLLLGVYFKFLFRIG